MPSALDPDDEWLLAEARAIIGLRQRQDWHHIGCALRTRSGRVFTAVHLEVIVAVNRDGDVVAPCGICRELISDYAPRAKVIVPGIAGPELVSVATLLPNKYVRTGA
jgi:cytidine deaminase